MATAMSVLVENVGKFMIDGSTPIICDESSCFWNGTQHIYASFFEPISRLG